jgi:hypothetical protein
MSGIVSGLIGGAIVAALTAYIAKNVGKAGAPGQLRFGMLGCQTNVSAPSCSC